MSSTFIYYCTNCGAQAIKPPCVGKPGTHDTPKKADATLGTWRCPNGCTKPIKVRRERVNRKEKS